MRYLLLLGFLLGACAPSKPSAGVRGSGEFPEPRAIVKKPAPLPQPVLVKPPARPVLPPQKRLGLKYYDTTRDGIGLRLVAFDDRDMVLRVADQPKGLGSRWIDAKSAAATYGGVAAINGGFFSPDGKPLGLLIETGTRRGGITRTSLGSGMYVSGKNGSSLMRREVYQKTKDNVQAFNLMQSGPMLAENGQTISGLSQQKSRPRSFILWDGRHHWAIGQSSSCSLHALSKALAGRSPAGFDVHTALNLDGGRSADLWVGTQLSGGGKSHRSFLNKPVRNYLVLKRK